MRFKKVGKLKMSSKNNVLSGSQRSIEVLRSSDPNCTVEYVDSKGANDQVVVESVPQKVNGACHPHLEVSEAWVPGDVVEVFDNFSWKMATVSEVLGKKYIFVRLLGSSQGFKVRKSDIRARKSWQDVARVMAGRGNNDCNGGKLHSQNSSFQVQKSKSSTKLLKKDDCSTIRGESFPDIHNPKVRIRKRSTDCSSEAFDKAGRKVRVIEKDGRYCRLGAANPSELPAQVDAVTHRPASLNHRLGGHLEKGVKGRKPAGTIRESNDADSITCSVGSCSVTGDGSCELPYDVSVNLVEEIAGHFRENRSTLRLGCEEHCLPTNEVLAAEIHRLELHAYRCTIEALHASGPLSWEQEVLITNLRLSLNISNDEHLMQLKHLISADNRIPIK